MSVDVVLKRLGPETVEAEVRMMTTDPEALDRQMAALTARQALARLEGQRSSSIGIRTLSAIPGNRLFLVTMNACEANVDDDDEEDLP